MPNNAQLNLTPPISIRNIMQNGVICENVVDEALMPSGSVNFAINLHGDRIGSATVRDGITLLGTQIVDDKGIKGLHQALDTGTGTNDRLIAVCDTTWYALISDVWTAKRTSLTTNTKARFTNFIDLVFGVNGVEVMQTWDMGGGNFTTTSAVSAPSATFIDNFRSRVWAAKTSGNPSRLYYSSVASSGGTILWTGTDSSFIDVAPGDGEDITGIKKFGTGLYVFKNSTIYRVFSINQTEPDPQILVGTYSQESITVAKDGMYWHHPSGIYRLRKGETNPIEISRPVYDIIKNVTRTNYSEVSSWNDDDHCYFSVGSISVYGITINNCVLRWTISTEIWTIYSYAQNLIVGNTYDNSNAIDRVVGDDDGNVYTFNSGNTDNTIAINYELETRWLNLSGLRSEEKVIKQLAAIHENMQGAEVGQRTGSKNRLEIEPIGSLEDQESIFNSLSINAKRIKLSIRGTSNSGSSIFQGFEILDWTNEGIIS